MAKRVLWVTDEVPDSGLGGGSIRQFHLLRRLADTAEVDLLLVGELRDDDLRSRLRGVQCLPRPPALMDGWSTARRRLHNLATMVPGRPPSEVVAAAPVVTALRARLSDTSGYAAVQVEHEHLAALLPRRRSCPWAITLHNLMSVRYGQRAEVAGPARVRRLFQADAARARAWERRVARDWDLVIAMSDEDAANLPGPAAVVPNGVDLDRFRPTPLPGPPVLIFSASFNYEPNVDGAVWACEEILPRLRRLVPGARLMLVGREPNDRVRSLASVPGVETHFDVPQIPPFLAAARVALVPLRQGSGTRLKGLEAMAAGRPLAGTSVGLEGLGLQDGRSAVIADDADGLAAGAARLLTDDRLAEALSGTARSLAESRFGWDRVAEAYIDRLLRGRP